MVVTVVTVLTLILLIGQMVVNVQMLQIQHVLIQIVVTGLVMVIHAKI